MGGCLQSPPFAPFKLCMCPEPIYLRTKSQMKFHKPKSCNLISTFLPIVFTPKKNRFQRAAILCGIDLSQILLNLSMNCWNSAFNAQGSRVVIVGGQVGAVKIYVPAVETLRKEGTKLRLPPKLVEKLVWVPVFSFCKISFPVRHLMPYYARNWPFSPPNRLTLQITFISGCPIFENGCLL
jgi:hypothetical protein